ncbi:MAG TPA: DUF6659 family protein [Candidatus Nitrosopolaris sp.]|nr:DUF6659 family protein [Candidatus Nitrosopolaris sp.]
MDSKHHQLEELCDNIFTLSPQIRFVGIISRMGKLVAGGMRKGMKSMEDREDSSRLYLEFALRNEMRKDFDAEFGRTIYSFSERERIKLASFPLNEYLLRVSMENDVPHFEVIKNILKILNNVH